MQLSIIKKGQCLQVTYKTVFICDSCNSQKSFALEGVTIRRPTDVYRAEEKHLCKECTSNVLKFLNIKFKGGDGNETK